MASIWMFLHRNIPLSYLARHLKYVTHVIQKYPNCCCQPEIPQFVVWRGKCRTLWCQTDSLYPNPLLGRNVKMWARWISGPVIIQIKIDRSSFTASSAGFTSMSSLQDMSDLESYIEKFVQLLKHASCWPLRRQWKHMVGFYQRGYFGLHNNTFFNFKGWFGVLFPMYGLI